MNSKKPLLFRGLFVCFLLFDRLDVTRYNVIIVSISVQELKMSPQNLRDILKIVGGAGCTCCPDELPFMSDIANRSRLSRSSVYRYLVWGERLGYIAFGTRKRGTIDATTFALTENGELWLASLRLITEPEYNELVVQKARAL
jgi:hypothetical protein